MKTRILKSVSALTSAIMLALTLAAASVSGQEASGQDERGGQVQESAERSSKAARIEGLWDSRVTARNCQTGNPIITFRGLAMFVSGGSLTATNSAPPATNGPALGRWRYLGGQHYTATFRFFRFNPDGSFAGSQKVTLDIELSDSGNEFSGTTSFETFDANDNLIQTGCGTETSTRLE